MVAQQAYSVGTDGIRFRRAVRRLSIPLLVVFLLALTLLAVHAAAQDQPPDWQAQVRKYCDAKDWPSAMRMLEQEIVRAPDDLDLKAWRARVLAWSGKLAEAQQEYLAILKISANDPDNWAGLASVYAREGKRQRPCAPSTLPCSLIRNAGTCAPPAHARCATPAGARKLVTNFTRRSASIPKT